MTTVEERLVEIFSQLPALEFGFKPVYHFGDGIELNQFIIGKAKEKKSPYPLIYQTSTNWKRDRNRGEITSDLELIICTQNKKVDMYNTQRWATSYRNVLLPLAADVETSLVRSDVIRSDFNFAYENRPNYSGEEFQNKRNKTVDIIDALILKVRVTFNKGCVNPNIFYNV